MKLKYNNITISGGIAVGTTTLFNNLKPYLRPYGWRFKSTGEFIRQYTQEKINPVATLVSDDFDRKIETKVAKTLEKEKKWVIEGWLSGFVARNIKTTLRILLICSEESLRIDRVVNRDKITIREAKKMIKTRENGNLKKWRRIYGNYNFFDPKYYHLVIDTYSSGPLETVGKVLDRLGYKNNNIQVKINQEKKSNY